MYRSRHDFFIDRIQISHGETNDLLSSLCDEFADGLYDMSGDPIQ